MYIISLILVALILLPSFAVGKPPEDKDKDKDNGKPPKTKDEDEDNGKPPKTKDEDEDNGKPPKTEDEDKDNGKPPKTKDEVKFATITSSSGSHGNVSPSGSVKVKIGDDQRFKISANGGYRIEEVVVDGETVFSCDSEGKEHVRKWEYWFENVEETHDISAKFDRDVFTIKALARGPGRIIPSGAVKLSYGGNQDFTIRATQGFCIDDVQISPSDDSNTLNMGEAEGASIYTFSFNGVTSDYTMIVTFARLKEPEPDPETDPVPLTIESEAGDGGSIDPSGEVEMEYGSDQTFTMTPDDPCYGIAVVEVDGVPVDVGIDEGNGEGTYTFSNVTSDHTIKATFEEITYTITATADEGGIIVPSGEVEVACGSEQVFIITPEPCHRISEVLVDDVPVDVYIDEETGEDTYTFTGVASDHTIHATFEEITEPYTIAVTSGTGGNIVPSGEVQVECGGSQTFTMTPDLCNGIAKVLVDGMEVDVYINDETGEGTYTFTNVTSDHTIDATFEEITYTIAASAGEGGVIDPSGEVEVACGSEQVFTITPDPCHRIAEFEVDDTTLVDVVVDEETGESTYAFTGVASDHTISVAFEEITEPYTITATAGEFGSIVPSGEVEVACGSEQTFTITPNESCYGIAEVQVDGEEVDVEIDEDTGARTYTFTDVSSDHTIHATFEEITEPYIITATSDEFGSIVPSGEVEVACGSEQTFTITPYAPCYGIAEVKVDSEEVDVDIDEETGIGTYTFTSVASDHTIQATFEKITYTITATAGEHGSIVPSGEVQVECGGSHLFKIKPDEGYTRGSVLVDGSPVKTKGNKYEFTDVTSDHTIEVTFVNDPDEDDLIGDVNNDGKVGSDDAIFILLIVTGQIEPTEQQKLAADVNSDGVIDVNDALFVLSIVAGLAAPDANIDSALLQNFPNPFNPETWIPFRLSEGSEVTIEIYDVTGHLLRRLLLGHKSAGFYTSQERAAYWDGCNEDGERVASGVYFYAIRAGNFTDMKKMIISQ